MSFRTTIVLFAVVATLVAVLLINMFVNEGGAAQTGIVDRLTRVGLKPSDVVAVELLLTEPNEQKLVFTRQDSGWVLSQPYHARVEGSRIDAVVAALFAAKPVNTSTLTSNLKTHGLERPSLQVTLRSKHFGSATVNIGETTIGGIHAITFITTGERPDTPIAVSHNDLLALFRPEAASQDGPAYKSARWLADYRQKRLLGVDIHNLATGIKSIKLSRGPSTVALAADNTGTWTFTTPEKLGVADTLGDTAAMPDTITGVRPLINSLTMLQANDSQDFIENVSDADLARYGLAPSDPNVLRVELHPRQGPPEILYLGKPVEPVANPAAPASPAAPAKVYSHLEGESTVVKMSANVLPGIAKLLADPTILVNRDLIPQVNQDHIDAIDLTVAGQLIKLRRLGTAEDMRWVVYGGPEPHPAAQAPVRALLEALTFPRAARDVLTGPNQEPFLTPQAEFKVWLNGMAKTPVPMDGKLPPEPAVMGSPISFTVGKTDRAVTYLRRTTDSTTTVFRLLNERVAPFLRGRFDYIDPRIPTFNVTQVNQLSFNRGNEAFLLTKTQDADPYYANGKWTFSEPPAMKGRTADSIRISNLLTMLATNQRAKLVSEAPKPEELKAWGLDPAAPRMRITIGLPGKMNNDLVYELGNETDEKKSVFMKVGGRSYVVQVPAAIFNEFNSAELRDPILFRVDAAKVSRVELVGWKGAGAAPSRVNIRREKSGWVVTEPAGFAVDPAKVDALVKLLEAPRAMEYVAKIPPPAEHGTSEAEGGLQITLLLGDDKDRRVLNLGKEDPAKKGVYATASTLRPGEMVLLPSAAFLPYVSSARSISK